jgi:hypothetical protein
MDSSLQSTDHFRTLGQSDPKQNHVCGAELFDPEQIPLGSILLAVGGEGVQALFGLEFV